MERRVAGEQVNLDVVVVGLSTRWHSFSLLYFILFFFSIDKNKFVT